MLFPAMGSHSVGVTGNKRIFVLSLGSTGEAFTVVRDLASDRSDAPCAASTRESKLPAASAGSSGSQTKFFTTPTIFRLVSKDLPRFLDRKQSFLRPERSFVRNIRENLG